MVLDQGHLALPEEERPWLVEEMARGHPTDRFGFRGDDLRLIEDPCDSHQHLLEVLCIDFLHPLRLQYLIDVLNNLKELRRHLLRQKVKVFQKLRYLVIVEVAFDLLWQGLSDSSALVNDLQQLSESKSEFFLEALNSDLLARWVFEVGIFELGELL